ncbi:probable ADP-ribosylation factor GTPase-activating protein AGD14 [Phalaenopsis equestris]|uniref:probable ADP-ribosylation factor GTPase-activating protein AGD14 n=1 Tax=Phalaenopsis equestris TaxID=78828 RepID=UPI0009E4E80E|nr:probable ADP-ribosylation factor GTPase-activating protein AGD14 [Phalaenopsis equestris]
MSSRKEEERNEKVIRGLMKLPPNRRCINCNALGPQYVCTNFWTFVCIACSGIHREFTHRVKSVSMAKFTAQEVEALQNGGNQRARELYLKDWDMQNMKLPDSSYPDKIREFIKGVYVEKKYVGGRSFDKPPRDPLGFMTHEEHRRASSYHSFSQSPPYDNQYEDRRYGKPRNMLTRKPGSDHGHYEGNISSILDSPGRVREHMYEDQFANESSRSRISDYSVSSAGDPFRSTDQSPRIYNEHSTQRSASLGSFGSFDGKSLHKKSANSGALSDAVLRPEDASVIKQPNQSTSSSLETSAPPQAAVIDLFSLQFTQLKDSKTSVDLFADFSNQPSCSYPLENKHSCSYPPENKPLPIPSSQNDGWAMFDTIHLAAPNSEANKALPSGIPSSSKVPTEIIDPFSSKHDTSQLFTAKKSTFDGEATATTNQWQAGFTEVQNAATFSAPVWNAFDDSFQKGSPAFYVNSLHETCGLVNESSIFGGQHSDVALPKTSSTQEWKSTNPFDISYDVDAGASNMFLDVSSLQGALPNAQLPNTYLEGLSQPWFQHNSASTFSPTIPQAGFPYVGGQVPSSQLPKRTSQGSSASGNPFA